MQWKCSTKRRMERILCNVLKEWQEDSCLTLLVGESMIDPPPLVTSGGGWL